MGRRSRISKIRSEIMRRRWLKHRLEAGIEVSPFTGRVPRTACAVIPFQPSASQSIVNRARCVVIVPHTTIPALRCDEHLSDHVTIENASQASFNDDSVDDEDFDVRGYTEAYEEDEFIQTSSKQLDGEIRNLHRQAPKRQQCSARKPLSRQRLDQTQPQDVLYFRVWAKNWSAGVNSFDSFRAGQQESGLSSTSLVTDSELLHAAALHITREPISSPLISLTSSFIFALKYAFKIRAHRPSERIWISIVDGASLVENHTVWRSPDVCRAIHARRMLASDFNYRGCFELFVLREVSSPCIMACVDFNQLLHANSSSLDLRTFLQLNLYRPLKKSTKTIYKEIDTPSMLDQSTGAALGALVGLVFSKSQLQPTTPRAINRFIDAVLGDYKVPDFEKWRTNQEFLEAVKDGISNSMTRGYPRLCTTPTPKAPPMGLSTPPKSCRATVRGHAQQMLQIDATPSAGRSKPSPDDSIPDDSMLEAAPSELKRSPDLGEGIELISDFASDDYDLDFASAVRKSEGLSDASSQTLGRRSTAPAGCPLPRIDWLQESPNLEWQSIERRERSNAAEHGNIRQAFLQSWLYAGQN